MTRLGWGILIVVVLAIAGFASMLSFGPLPNVRPNAAVQEPVPDDEPGMFAVPVAGIPRAAISNNWGDPREGGARRHHGIDIMAPGGTPVLAAAPGRIEKLFQSRLGGTTLYVRSPDHRWTYYYAHLSAYVAGIREGMTVKAGDRIAYVGDTGDAGPGNYHLHFGLARLRPDERWWQGQDVNPYPLLAGNVPRR